jgi:hypothetical protein
MAGPAFGTNVGQDFTFNTDIDLTNNQFYFVQLGSDGFLDVVSTAGVRALGVLQSNENGTASTTKGATVRTAGTSKIQCGGTFSAGDLLSADSSGKAVKYTGATVFTGTPYTVSGSQVLGIAVESGSAGVVSTMLFQPSGLCAAGD